MDDDRLFPWHYPLWMIAFRPDAPVPAVLTSDDLETRYAGYESPNGVCLYLFTEKGLADEMAAHLQLGHPLAVPLNCTADLVGFLNPLSHRGFTHVTFDAGRETQEIRAYPIGAVINDLRAVQGDN